MFPLFQQKICGILEFGIFFFLEFLLKSVTPKTKSCELSSTLFYCRDLRFFLLVLLCTYVLVLSPAEGPLAQRLRYLLIIYLFIL